MNGYNIIFRCIINETETAECVNPMTWNAIVEADLQGSGALIFLEFTEFVREKKHICENDKIIGSHGQMTTDEISFDDFEQLNSGTGGRF